MYPIRRPFSSDKILESSQISNRAKGVLTQGIIKNPLGLQRSPQGWQKAFKGWEKTPHGWQKTPVGLQKNLQGRQKTPVGSQKNLQGRKKTPLGSQRNFQEREETPLNLQGNLQGWQKTPQGWQKTPQRSFPQGSEFFQHRLHRSCPERTYSTQLLTNTRPRSFLYPERKSVAPRRLSYTESIVMDEKRIVNERQLANFLHQHAEYDRKVLSMSLEESKILTVSPLAPPMTPAQTNPISMLHKYRYQLCCKPSHESPTEDDSTEIRCTENVWCKLKVSEKMLSVWCERLRKWICQTIIMRLVKEIEDINKTLCSMGSPELQIGAVNIYTLRQMAMTKRDVLPTLASLIPYLDMALNQEYLIRRLKDLACGGCMRDYKWNSGGSYRDCEWSHDLPTDSAIVIHLFCSYMDFLLPPDAHSLDGKAFSYKYFKKTPEKPVFSRGHHYIYQSKLNPPHFAVVIDDDAYCLSKGHNNLFCAILLLLHYTKTKEYNMLGRVNLGPSGLNMAWIIDW